MWAGIEFTSDLALWIVAGRHFVKIERIVAGDAAKLRQRALQLRQQLN